MCPGENLPVVNTCVTTPQERRNELRCSGTSLLVDGELRSSRMSELGTQRHKYVECVW